MFDVYGQMSNMWLWAVEETESLTELLADSTEKEQTRQDKLRSQEGVAPGHQPG